MQNILEVIHAFEWLVQGVGSVGTPLVTVSYFKKGPFVTTVHIYTHQDSETDRILAFLRTHDLSVDKIHRTIWYSTKVKTSFICIVNIPQQVLLKQLDWNDD